MVTIGIVVVALLLIFVHCREADQMTSGTASMAYCTTGPYLPSLPSAENLNTIRFWPST